jgi:hypothetical protein
LRVPLAVVGGLLSRRSLRDSPGVSRSDCGCSEIAARREGPCRPSGHHRTLGAQLPARAAREGARRSRAGPLQMLRVRERRCYSSSSPGW